MIPLRSIRLDSNNAEPKWKGRAQRIDAYLECDCSSLVTTVRHADGRPIETWNDPLDALDWMSNSRGGRWVGYTSYDLGRLFEKLPARSKDDLNLPLFAFALTSFSDQTESAPSRLPRRCQPAKVRSTFTRAAYESAVRKCIDYIAAGDIFQANLSQRFTVQSDLPAGDVYEHLLQAGGARYGAYLQFNDWALVSHSPELFFKVNADRSIITRPIKGTRPRQPGMDIELRDSIKDQAELNMIVDLERNDLGRVCEIGSVKVSDPRTIEAHPTVYHGVATIEGRLRADVSFSQLLRATFPGGSVTGAPKIRAMEIIEELEPVRRGPYCGAIGYIDADGSMEFNIAIRTMIVKDGLVHIPVGGGIVADSDPSAEYEETLVKAQAMFAALGIEYTSLTR